MARPSSSVTGIERTFGEDQLIVSKTDLRGYITYANRVFIDISGYTEAEVLGKPHCLLRHPDMPRAVFSLLWDTLTRGQEIFAYIVNRCKNGDHYWVFAHVTPTFDARGQITGYHSNRRCPERDKLAKIQPLYRELLAIESNHSNPKDQIAASRPHLARILAENGLAYEEFVFSI